MYDHQFRWNEWNLEKLAKHGVSREEVEYVVCDAQPPFPRRIEDEKIMVWGQTWAGRYLQVIYIYSPAEYVFVLHARPMNDTEKRRLRRRRQ